VSAGTPVLFVEMCVCVCDTVCVCVSLQRVGAPGGFNNRVPLPGVLYSVCKRNCTYDTYNSIPYQSYPKLANGAVLGVVDHLRHYLHDIVV
jgi:hypothetical protein